MLGEWRNKTGQSLEGTSLLYFRTWMSKDVAEGQSQDWDLKPGPIPPRQGEVGHQQLDRSYHSNANACLPYLDAKFLIILCQERKLPFVLDFSL